MNFGKLPRHYIIDIFKRILTERETVKLRISYDRKAVFLYFIDGYAAFIHPAYQKDKIGNMLVKNEIVTRDNVNTALVRQRELAKVDRITRIGTILVDMGFTTKKDLQGFIKTEIAEAIKNILEADDVSVIFLPNTETLKRDIIAAVDIDRLIEEELGFIGNAKPPGINGFSLDDVFVLAVGPDRMRDLTKDMWKLLVLLDGKRAVTQLTRVSGLSPTQISMVITDLLEQSIIKRTKIEPISKPKKIYIKMKKPVTSMLNKIIGKLRTI